MALYIDAKNGTEYYMQVRRGSAGYQRYTLCKMAKDSDIQRRVNNTAYADFWQALAALKREATDRGLIEVAAL